MPTTRRPRGQEVIIQIKTSQIKPQSIRVKTGDRVVWTNETTKDCVILFGMPTCPFHERGHKHATCRYPIRAGSSSVPYEVKVGSRAEYEYEIQFAGRGHHRGSPRLIVNG